MAHAHTPYYVVQSLVSILLELEECRTAAEREHALREHIIDDTLKEDLCLVNDLLGTHVSQCSVNNVTYDVFLAIMLIIKMRMICLAMVSF